MKISSSQYGNISVVPTKPPPNKQNPKRPVQIGHRPIGGRTAAWTVGVLHEVLKRVGNMGIRLDDPGPDAHSHWCIIVGNYYHEGTIGEGGILRYGNGELNWKDGWLLCDINDGDTTFNDAAIVEAALKIVNEMPDTYDLWENNCHHFAIQLIDKICPPGYKEISTARRYHRRSSSTQFGDEREK